MNFFEYFNLKEDTPSIYAYAPVFLHTLDHKKVIIKKTKPQDDRLAPLFAWQKHLNKHNILCVEALVYKEKKVHKFDDINWVSYPFIEGEAYVGSKEQIIAAGELLGKIHLKSNTPFFNHGFSWGNYDDEFYDDVSEDIKNIQIKYVKQASTPSGKSLIHKLNEMNHNRNVKLTELKLPLVDATWDYKASNLIYSNKGPVLIDTDNAGRLPRIIDLALALLLFHTSVETAPARIFSIEEWSYFFNAYKKYVSLTNEECLAWQDILLFVYMDEVLWAISDINDEVSEHQQSFIESLVNFDINNYLV